MRVNVLEIKVNGRSIQLGSQIPQNVNYINIICDPFPKPIPRHQGVLVSKWLWDLVQRLDNEYLTYNNILIKKEDVNRIH